MFNLPPLHSYSYVPIEKQGKLERISFTSLLENYFNEIKNNTPEVHIEDTLKFHQHFLIDEETLMKIVKSQSYRITEIVDTFFDVSPDNNYTLLDNDCILRFRNGLWSLKYQVSNNNGVLHYLELTSQSEIIEKLHVLLNSPGEKKSDPIFYCSYAYASILSYRYIFPEISPTRWWIDVMEFRNSNNRYVIATIDFPLLKTNSFKDQWNNSEFEDFYSLDIPISSKLIAYLQDQKRENTLKYIKGSDKFSSDNSIYPKNPLGEIEKIRKSFLEMMIEQDVIDFENVSSYSSDDEIID